MTISIIAAIAKNNVIGNNNRLPWHLPSDMRRFRKITMDKAIIMGQKTFESIGKPLAGRFNIILSKDPNLKIDKCMVVNSIEKALEKSKNFSEIMVCGGASVYKQFLPLANKMYLTLINAEFEGDAYFPDFSWQEWQEIERIDNFADEENSYDYTFLTLIRK